jgi:hypothetical protein
MMIIAGRLSFPSYPYQQVYVSAKYEKRIAVAGMLSLFSLVITRRRARIRPADPTHVALELLGNHQLLLLLTILLYLC